MRFADVDDECRLDLDQLRSLLSERTRVVAFPWASNAVGTRDAGRRDRRSSRTTPARSRGSTPCTTGRTARSTSQAVGADVLLCSPYKFYGPHLGLAFGRRELLESWRPYKVRPAADSPVGHRYETGTLAARAARRLRRRGRLPRRDRLGLRRSSTSARSASSSSTGCRRRGRCTAIPTMDGRVPTFAITHESVSPAGGRGATRRARLRGLARQLLRRRDHAAPRPGRRRGPRRHRPLQHRGRGRAPARRARPRSRRTDTAAPVASASGEPGARRIGSGSMPRASASASVSRWKRTMSTTGCRVGSRVTSTSSSLEHA